MDQPQIILCLEIPFFFLFRIKLLKNFALGLLHKILNLFVIALLFVDQENVWSIRSVSERNWYILVTIRSQFRIIPDGLGTLGLIISTPEIFAYSDR